MGIKGLIPFLNEKVPGSMSELSLESLSGEYVAVDASTALYQFSIAIRDSSYFNSLVNSNGESTSHLYGLMSRSLKLLESGIKPVFVFDSKPPELKLKTLDKRRQKREEASSSLKQAISEGDVESIKKLVGRTVKVTKEMNDSAKKLLRLMGVPVIEAMEEAEAQCAYLVRNNLCRFVASEDTDTLVFGGAFLLRNVTASSNKKILKVDLEKVLAGLELTFDQFVDFCILCGCDYCDSLEGVGPKTAYSLVKKYDSLEDIVRLKGANYDDFKEAREYFLAPKVNEYDQGSVKMGTLDVEALTEFLVNDNNFSKERVERFVEKLLKLRSKKVQTSLLSFLTQSATNNKSVKDLCKKGKTSKVVTSFRSATKGTTGSKGSGKKRQKVDVDSKEDNKDGLDKKPRRDSELDEDEVEHEKDRETEKVDKKEDNKDEDDDDELFEKLFDLDGEDLDQPVEEEDVEKTKFEKDSEVDKNKDFLEDAEDEDNKPESVENTEIKQDEVAVEVKAEENRERGYEKDVKLEEELKDNEKESDTSDTDQNLDKELEDKGIELKLFSSKRVLDDDEDNMTTATSENMNCDVGDVKKEGEKKGLRNLFDVLVAYPKPSKKQKN